MIEFERLSDRVNRRKRLAYFITTFHAWSEVSGIYQKHIIYDAIALLWPGVSSMKGEGMAKKSRFGNVTFLTIKVSETRKKDFAKWADRPLDDILRDLDNLVSEEHKLTASFQPESGTYLVSVTCKDEASLNHDLCFSTRAGSLEEALALTAFKFAVVIKNSPWRDVAGDENWG